MKADHIERNGMFLYSDLQNSVNDFFIFFFFVIVIWQSAETYKVNLLAAQFS